MEAARIADGFDMEKILRAASDIGGYAPETDARYEPNCRAEEPDDSERFAWVSRWLGLKEPEAEVLFNLGRQPYTPSDITGSICWPSWMRSLRIPDHPEH